MGEKHCPKCGSDMHEWDGMSFCHQCMGIVGKSQTQDENAALKKRVDELEVALKKCRILYGESVEPVSCPGCEVLQRRVDELEIDNLRLRTTPEPDKSILSTATTCPDPLTEARERIGELEDVLEDKRRIARDIAVMIEGDNAATSPSLIDVQALVSIMLGLLDQMAEALDHTLLGVCPSCGKLCKPKSHITLYDYDAKLALAAYEAFKAGRKVENPWERMADDLAGLVRKLEYPTAIIGGQQLCAFCQLSEAERHAEDCPLGELLSAYRKMKGGND